MKTAVTTIKEAVESVTLPSQGNPRLFQRILLKLLEQALHDERNQIIDAFDEGRQSSDINSEYEPTNGKEYYKLLFERPKM